MSSATDIYLYSDNGTVAKELLFRIAQCYVRLSTGGRNFNGYLFLRLHYTPRAMTNSGKSDNGQAGSHLHRISTEKRATG
jgi:hypothetical protein